MEGIPRYSKLNPLARCFVPLNTKKVLQDARGHESEIENLESKTKEMKLRFIVEFKSTRSRRNLKRGTSTKKSDRCEILDLTLGKTKLMNENFFFSVKSVVSEHSKSIVAFRVCRQKENETDLLKYLFLTLLGILPSKKRSGHAIPRTEKKEDSRTGTVAAEETCTCPPMFGCTVPPEFFGNPFNLKSSCKKKTVHVCHNSKENGFNAAQPFLKKAKTNVGLISEDDSSKNIGSIGSKCAHLKISENLNSTKCVERTSGTSLNADPRASDGSSENQDSFHLVSSNVTASKVPKAELSCIDDDFHSLLDEGICMEVDEGIFGEKNDVLETKLLTEQTSPDLSFDPDQLTRPASCNPPCSVWCDSVPLAAKEAYRKSVKSLPRSQGILWNFTKAEKFSIEHRVHMRRSKVEHERMFLHAGLDSRRLRPLTGLKHYNRTSEHKFAPRANALARVIGSNSVRYNTSLWRIVDGKDSLWQAMPDCV